MAKRKAVQTDFVMTDRVQAHVAHQRKRVEELEAMVSQDEEMIAHAEGSGAMVFAAEQRRVKARHESALADARAMLSELTAM